MSFCKCSGAGQSKNTGRPAQNPFGVKVGGYYVPMFADDGTRNQIDENDVINQAYLDGKINEADPSKRWYPVFEWKQVTDERADPSTEGFSDNSEAITAQGLRRIQYWLLNQEPVFLGKLENLRCEKLGIYYVDNCGNLQGEVSADGTKLNPLELNTLSFEPRNIAAVDGATQKIQVRQDHKATLKDKNMRMIPAEDITADLLNGLGLIDVNGVASSITTSAFDVQLNTEYGGFNSEIPATGWVLADFSLYNLTQDSSVTISGVTESSITPGLYSFTIPVQTSADVLRLTDSKTGYEMTALDITIP